MFIYLVSLLSFLQILSGHAANNFFGVAIILTTIAPFAMVIMLVSSCCLMMGVAFP